MTGRGGAFDFLAAIARILLLLNLQFHNNKKLLSSQEMAERDTSRKKL
jgi:hypothetical protein